MSFQNIFLALLNWILFYELIEFLERLQKSVKTVKIMLLLHLFVKQSTVCPSCLLRVGAQRETPGLRP